MEQKHNVGPVKISKDLVPNLCPGTLTQTPEPPSLEDSVCRLFRQTPANSDWYNLLSTL